MINVNPVISVNGLLKKHPVLSLRRNLKYRFRDSLKGRYTKARSLGVFKGIRVLTVDKGVRSRVEHFKMQNGNMYLHAQVPFANNGKVFLHASFLTFMWFASYLIVTYVDFVIDKRKGGVRLDYVDNANNVFDAMQQLVDFYDEYDFSKLPSPYDCTEYSEKINNVFIEAVNFMTLHEFAHVIKMHAFKREMGADSIEQEIEADEFAYCNAADGKCEINHLIGFLIALSFELFFKPKINKTNSHVNPIERLESFVGMYSVEGERLKLCAAVMLQIRMHIFNKECAPDVPSQFDDANDFYLYHIDLIKRLSGDGV